MRDVTRPRAAVFAVSAALGLTVLVGCGNASQPSQAALSGTSLPSSSASTPNASPVGTESSPPGDIPDNQAFVVYRSAAGFTVQVPEGWARSQVGSGVSFTDKLNSVTIEEQASMAAPTTASVKADVVPGLATSVPKFSFGSVKSVSRTAGNGVLVTYQADSATDPVTGKVVRDAVERYLFWHADHLVTLTLTGPLGADNVDPWMKVTSSLRWTA